MRKLNTSDVFKVARIIKSANLKEKVIEIYKNKGDKDMDTIGLDVIFSVIEGCSEKNIESEFYSFLGGVAGLKTDEVANLELNKLIEILVEISKENDLGYFFKLATR